MGSLGWTAEEVGRSCRTACGDGVFKTGRRLVGSQFVLLHIRTASSLAETLRQKNDKSMTTPTGHRNH